VCSSSPVLQGCGTGSSAVRSPAPRTSPPTYPFLIAQTNKLTGEVRQYQADDPGALIPIGGQINGTLLFTSGKLSSATVDVSSIKLTFSETFTTFSEQQLAGLPLPLSVYVAEKTATDGTARSLLLLDPSSAGLSYSTLGAWGYDEPSGSPPKSYGGWFAEGIQTRGADIPTTGTANYVGGMAGTYADGTTIHHVAATANASADFGARNIEFQTTNTHRVDINAPGSLPVLDTSLDFTGTSLTYSAGVNRVTIPVTSSTMSGNATARFFGPAAAEFGGAFSMTSKDAPNTEQMTGSFVLKKQ
jgi:hypothetical protein